MSDRPKLTVVGEDEQLDLGLPPEVQQFPRRIPGGYKVGKCRSCKADVIWAAVVDAEGNVKFKRRGAGGPLILDQYGRKVPTRMPMDPAPRSDGGFQLIGNQRVQKIPHGVFVAPNERYVSHFASCPNAEKHRRR